MAKTKRKLITVVETKITSDKLEIHWEKFDLKQFRKGLKVELADGTNKANTSCASIDPNLMDKVARLHLKESSDPATQRLQTEIASKREQGSKR